MNNHDAEIGKDDVLDFESHNSHIPIVGSKLPCSSQSSRVNNVRNDETDFYKGMTFKNKEELANSLKIACLKKDFRLKKGMKYAKSNVSGTHEHGYAVFNAYRYMLEVANPGSKTVLSLDENGSFKYFFVSYAAWITGFQEMRKVIAIDGTFLWSKYEGVLLSAVAHDAENHIFPVAFLHPSIRKMVSTIYPASHYGCCMRHLGENIRNNFHNSKVVTHFYKAAKAYDRCEFNDHFNQIRDLVPKAAETLERIGFHTWRRAFYPGNRYYIMTSNIAESVNSMFDVEREFAIVALFDEINRRFAFLFHQRRMELVNSANRFVPSIEKDISKYVNAGNKLLAHQIANYKFSVIGHGDVATVDLQRRTCTCRIFDLDKIPCPHAMAVLRAQYGADFGN
ncbi:uncharacterized protein [Solanum tuberosum]|uniref:uncharacterized protein n=1 Tax=Solanum tuberosum TaxID=4113 RepID=UPI00073A0056|nr:PREDICTED: uncharacterized protein LOC107058821 [Solanum tuberosum]